MPALPLIVPKTRAAPDSTPIDDAQAQQRSLSLEPRTERLVSRQSSGTYAIPTLYQGLNGSPQPGAVVGITLGSVAGFLLLIWLLWALSNGTGFIRTSALEEEDVVIRRRSRSPRRRRSRARTEMTSRSPARRVVRQERIVREVPAPRQPSRVRETIIVEDSHGGRRVDGDDVVEVIEEHSSLGTAPPPRRKSRKSSQYR